MNDKILIIKMLYIYKVDWMILGTTNSFYIADVYE